MLVTVHWTLLRRPSHPLWHDQLCLYAYLHPRRNSVLYIGKADFATIHKRLSGRHKDYLFEDIYDEYEIEPEQLRYLHGGLLVERGCRRSSALLSDVESLLIKRLKPFGNIHSRLTRIERPSMRVDCTGFWPVRRCSFRDV